MTKIRKAMILLLVALSSVVSMAQQTDDLSTQVNAAIQVADWETALKLCSELTRATPEDATAWYRLGLATSKSGGDGAAARAAFEHALELGFTPGLALFGIARSYASDGELDATVETLEKLSQQGPSRFVVNQLAGDEAFAPLSSNPRYKAVLVQLTPCSSDEYRQFDFWLGNWNVVGPQGQTLGTNRVTQSMDGCMLMESWESARGSQKGMSINYYDRDKKTWSQIYRDNSGNVKQWPELVGGLVDGAMVLDSGAESQPRTRWSWS